MSVQAAQLLSELLLCTMGVTTVALTAGIQSDDKYAVIGSILAATLAGLYALSKRRAYLNVALTILSSAGVGSIGPGVMMWIISIISPTLEARISAGMNWQSSAGLGLFLGLGGWALVHAIIERWDRHADDIASKPFRYVTTQPDPDQEPEPDTKRLN